MAVFTWAEPWRLTPVRLAPSRLQFTELVTCLHQQPNQTREHSGKGRQNKRGAARLPHLKVRSRDIVVDMAALVKFHENKGYDEADGRPFQTAHDESKHPVHNLTPAKQSAIFGPCQPIYLPPWTDN